MVRKTRQGTLILKTLKTARRPLTPAEAHLAAKNEHPHIGLATVYRHIRTLAEGGLVVGVDYPGQPTRYEWVDGRDKTHFSCRGCDKLFALEVPQAEELPDLDLPVGFMATGGEYILYGKCPDCSNQNE